MPSFTPTPALVVEAAQTVLTHTIELADPTVVEKSFSDAEFDLAVRLLTSSDAEAAGLVTKADRARLHGYIDRVVELGDAEPARRDFVGWQVERARQAFMDGLAESVTKAVGVEVHQAGAAGPDPRLNQPQRQKRPAAIWAELRDYARRTRPALNPDVAVATLVHEGDPTAVRLFNAFQAATPGTQPKPAATAKSRASLDPDAALDELAHAHAARHGVSLAKAFDAVLDTPEGRAHYARRHAGEVARRALAQAGRTTRDVLKAAGHQD